LLTDTNRWPIGARLAIGLSKAGCEVSAVCPVPGHPLLKTRAVRQTFPYGALRPLDYLAAAIQVAEPDVIVPCDDRAVQHLHQLHARFRNLGTAGRSVVQLVERSLGPPESYSIVSSRHDLLRVAREEGLRIPNTVLLKDLDDLRSWHEQQTAPWVLKADGTWGGQGVRIAYTPEQTEKFFRELTRPRGGAELAKRLLMNRDRLWQWQWWNHSRPGVIVQSHIHGRPANCGVVCHHGRVLAGICVEVVSCSGWKGPATVVRTVKDSEMMRFAEQIARRLNLSGFFGLDFMINDTTGATYLIEMNPRCTPLCHLQLGQGRDLVEAFSAHLRGQPVREAPPVTENEMIAYFPQAWKCKSEFLSTSFLDAPQGEPELIEALLRPWSQRSLLGRFIDYLRLHTVQDGASGNCVFREATETRLSRPCGELEPIS
jgi:hypothetical protein